MEIYTYNNEICQLGDEFYTRKREIFPRSYEFFPQVGGTRTQEKAAIKKSSFPLKLYAHYFIAAALIVMFVNVSADCGCSETPISKTTVFVQEVQQVEAVEPEKYELEDILDLKNYQVVWDSYVIEKGDTLWDIAERHTGNGLAYHAIAERNQMRNPDLIFPGEMITIPILYSREE